MSSDLSHLSFRVLGYISEDGLWAAHCLETDLVGYGKTFNRALSDLVELTEMQVTFAFQTDQPFLLDHPADPRIFEIYNVLFRSVLHSFPKRRRVREGYRISSIPLPSDPDLKDSFVQA